MGLSIVRASASIALILAVIVAGCAAGKTPVGTGGGGGEGGGQTTCLPGVSSCKEGIGTACKPDGTSESFECDAEQGMICAPDGCKGPCSPAELGTSYLGCEYFPTVTLNPVWSGFHFAVAIANPSNFSVGFIVTRGADEVVKDAVAPNSLKVVTLPWVPELKGGDWSTPSFIPPEPGPSRVVVGGAYRLRTDRPVTVYQLSPLEYSLDAATPGCPLRDGACNSFSNDASLLLPKNASSNDYIAMSWPAHLLHNPGFITITATEDATIVELRAVGGIDPGGGISADGTGSVKLNRGDVLEVVAAPQTGVMNVYGEDLSGTRVVSSKPISVISGHLCANVPEASTSFCDHLEEAMFPIEALGSEYIVSVPDGPMGSWPGVLRLSAIAAGTTVTFDPPIAPEQTLGLGEKPLEVTIDQHVHVHSTAPIVVAQYMAGSTLASGGMLGDPSQSLAIPVEQFRTEYVFIASNTYSSNYVNVIAPFGAKITLDGMALSAADFQLVGGGAYQVARVSLANNTDVHRIEGDQPFGIVVYGYGDYTSYMYPGGLDLKRITVPPPK